MIFVYYNDDYEDMGGHGLESFDTEVAAESFIEKRMSQDYRDKRVDCYTVIEGDKLEIKKLEVITKIRLNQVR